MTAIDVDVVVIGGGVVGLAAAAEIARDDLVIALIERHSRAGQETSTHNSGVIHAGMYYPANSLKAELCVEGADRLYRFCQAHGVDHDRCGKLIVALSEEEIPALARLQQRGAANGVRGLEIVDRRFVRTREPHIEAAAALWSPETGRVDASGLVLALRRLAESRGVALLLGREAAAADGTAGGALVVRAGDEVIRARAVVNAAGLYADDVSARFDGERFRIYPCRGEYAELKPSRRAMVNALVYPLPPSSGHSLGVHLSRTTGGSVLLGPTVRYQARKDDYEDSLEPLDNYLQSARRMLPNLTLDDLRYGGSGIRAKLHPPEESFADFLIRRDARQPNLIHAAGIDSPGLTASLAIGHRVATLVREALT